MKCKSCGNMIAKSASVCPQCGGKVQRTSGCTILFLIVFILITFSVFLQAVVNKDSNSASSSPENIQEETKEQSENTIPKEAETQLVQPTEQEPVPVKEEEDKLAQSVEQKPVPVKEEEENKEEEVVTLETLIAKNREKVYSEMPFQEPEIGSVMIIRVDNEDTEGILHKITDKGILFGSEDAKVMFTWDRLSKKDLIKLRRSDYEEFAKEIATEWAQGELAKIEAEKLKKAEEAERKRQKAEAEFSVIAQRRDDISPEKADPFQVDYFSNDGAMIFVQNYLESKISSNIKYTTAAKVKKVVATGNAKVASGVNPDNLWTVYQDFTERNAFGVDLKHSYIAMVEFAKGKGYRIILLTVDDVVIFP